MTHRMRTLLLAGSLLAISGRPALAQRVNRADAVRRLLLAEMKARQIPGLQVAVVKGGRVVMHGEYGFANLQDSVPVSRRTLFTINSMTKAFTGVAIVQLVEAGKVDLDRGIGRYVADLPDAWRAVTVRQLLTHTSGLPDITDENAKMLSEAGDDSSWAMVRRLPVTAAPGERFSYNQNNYLLLGKLIDTVTGQPFTQVIADRQFRVAGMTRTAAAGFGDSYDVVPHAARGYTFRQVIGGQTYLRRKIRNQSETYSPFLLTAAGIRSTAEEIARWSIAVQRGAIFSKPGSLTTLWTPARLTNGALGGFGEFLNEWALGWPVASRPLHPAIVAIGGGRSGLFVYPEDDVAVVVLTNLQGAEPEAFIDKVAALYFDARPRPKGKP